MRFGVRLPIMGDGRLIRVSKFAGDTASVSYVVAEPDKARAMAIIRTKIGNPEYVFEDLGRVSAALLNAMKIEPGDFVRA